MPHPALTKLSIEFGLPIFLSAPRDVYLLILQRSIRMLVFGQSSITLAAFLTLHFSDVQMGLFMTLTLVGDAGLSLVLTMFADRLGRIKVFLGGSILMVMSGLVFAVSTSYPVLLLAATIGVMTPSGNEIGPFRPMEESIIAQLIAPTDRATIYAYYLTLSGVALALGALSAGYSLRALQSPLMGLSPLGSYRVMFCVYALAGLVNCLLMGTLSGRVEAEPKEGEEGGGEEEEEGLMMESQVPEEEAGRESEKKEEVGVTKNGHSLGLSPATRRKTYILSALFAVDNFAGGLVPVTIIVYYLTEKFHLSPSVLAPTFFLTQLLSAISTLAAGALARRIGNIRAMAFTHLPGGILRAFVPAPGSFGVVQGLLLAHFSVAKMDAGPRTAFVAGYIPAGERTAVMGIVNVAKMLAQSVGPTISGYLAGQGKLGYSFVIAGLVQAGYDLTMLYLFTTAEMVS